MIRDPDEVVLADDQLATSETHQDLGRWMNEGGSEETRSAATASRLRLVLAADVER